MRNLLIGLLIGLALGVAGTASATLPMSLQDREYGKFVESNGNIAVRFLFTAS